MQIGRFFPKQELLGSSPQKKKERAWRDGWHAARELGAAEFGFLVGFCAGVSGLAGPMGLCSRCEVLSFCAQGSVFSLAPGLGLVVEVSQSISN